MSSVLWVRLLHREKLCSRSRERCPFQVRQSALWRTSSGSVSSSSCYYPPETLPPSQGIAGPPPDEDIPPPPGLRDIRIDRPNKQTSFGFVLQSNTLRPGCMICEYTYNRHTLCTCNFMHGRSTHYPNPSRSLGAWQPSRDVPTALCQRRTPRSQWPGCLPHGSQ